MGMPSMCSPICGNGAIHAPETCDDGGTTSGNGCSATCTVETGYTCMGMPSVCNGICGDGLVRGTETCDTAGSGYFSVGAFTASGCATREHLSLTGDDRGGIAVGSSRVLYSGDTSTASFQLGMLGTGAALSGAKRDGLVSDLASGQVYAFGNGATPISLPGTDGNFASSFPFTINSLLRIDQTTGAVQNQVTLSSAITVTRDPSGDFNGVFSGSGFVALYTTPDGGSTNHVYTIDTVTGTVVDLGVLPSLWYDIAVCESWASWGIAEKIEGEVYLTYVAFESSAIWRTRVSDGMTRGVSALSDTSDMCSFGGSPSTGRWYFHLEDASQFTPGVGEHVGYCNASFATTDPGCNGSCQTTAGYTCSGQPSVCTQLPTCGTGAASVAPQQLTTTVNGYCVSPTQTVGQSFTVASSGKLVGIELGLDLCDAEPQDVGSIRLEVLRGAGVIASATLPAGFLENLCLATTPGPTNPAYFDLSASCASVTASEQLVMRLTPQGYTRCQANVCVGGFFDGLACVSDSDCISGLDTCVSATVGPSAASYSGGVLYLNDAPNAALEDLFFKVFTRAP
jgi:cysteine-rich repeat protein